MVTPGTLCTATLRQGVQSEDIPFLLTELPMHQTSHSHRLAPAVLLVIVVAAGQAVALVINAVLTVLDQESDALPGSAMFFLVFLYLLGAVWLFAAARGVYRGKAWPRGALVVAEALAVIVSFTYFQLGDLVVAGALLASGAAVLIALFTPALNRHLVQRRSRSNS